MIKKNKWLGIVCLLMALTVSSQAVTLLSQNFDDISTLPGSGWVLVNNSAAIGSTGWFQGNSGVFGSQAGAANSYIGANFNNAAFGGNISNWLILPVMTLDATGMLTFYTRTENPQGAPDQLEVRMSLNGASTNVGSTATSVGDFTTLLLTVNPTFTTTGYPSDWTQFQVSLASVVLPTNGRLAFRYVVPDTSTNGDYIGIDSVTVTSLVPEPSTVALAVIGVTGLLGASRYGRRKS